jgi:PAS domain S-box-containing protein
LLQNNIGCSISIIRQQEKMLKQPANPPSSKEGKMFTSRPVFLLFIISATIFTSELLIMIFLEQLHQLPHYKEALIDSILLIIVVFPILYFLVFKPLSSQEDKLRKINENLESLVRERTEELFIINKNLKQEIAERIRADELLQESKLNYQNLVESTSDWVWEVDKEGRYTYVSPRIRDLLGYEPEEVTGKTPFDLMPSMEAKRVGEIFATVVARQEPINSLENINLHKNGRSVILETSGLPFFGVGGEFLGYRGIDRDITDRKQYEDKLLKQREKLEETNIALRVILRESEITKDELEKNVLSNIKGLLLPYLSELESKITDKDQQLLMDIIKANINEITSLFTRKLKLEIEDLTPKEIQVADLIKQGRTNKEIAKLLNITISGVVHHRRNLRKKFDIKGKKINLRSHLLNM